MPGRRGRSPGRGGAVRVLERALNILLSAAGLVSGLAWHWTCYYEYPAGVAFSESEVSNNHPITDSPAVRRQIDGLRRGDQVHLRGRLVGYRDRLWGEFWRNSSLTRGDSGNGACEVVFVEEVEVLKPANPQWRKAYRMAG